MNTVNVLGSSLRRPLHEELAARLDRASMMRPTPGEPRKGYEQVDTFLAVASKHLTPSTRRCCRRCAGRSPTAARLVHDYLHAAKGLELALAHLKAREYGSVFDAGRSWQRGVGRRGRRPVRTPATRARAGRPAGRQSCDPRSTRSPTGSTGPRCAAPTRPHPTPRTPASPGPVARRLLRTVDSFWDAVEGRMVPDPPRPTHHGRPAASHSTSSPTRASTRTTRAAGPRRRAGPPPRPPLPLSRPVGQPQTSSASSTSSASLAFSWSTVSELPSNVEEKPHWGEMHTWSSVDVRRGLVEAAAQGVLRLQLAALGRDEPEHDELVRRHVAQRLEIARALVVVLQEEAVDGELVEQRLGHEVVAALGDPRVAEVAAAHVRGHGHALRAPGERLVEVADVGLVQVLGVLAALGHRRALLRGR